MERPPSLNTYLEQTEQVETPESVYEWELILDSFRLRAKDDTIKPT